MNIKSNNFYRRRSLSPKERAELDNLRAENAELRQIVDEQADALIELAEIIAEEDE